MSKAIPPVAECREALEKLHAMAPGATTPRLLRELDVAIRRAEERLEKALAREEREAARAARRARR